MSQYDFGTIDPDTKTGSALATDLNSWRTAVHSSHRGSSRPSYAVAGTIWGDDTTNPVVLYWYDGTDDIQIGTIDETANTFTVTLGAGSITATELATNSVGSDEIATGAVDTDELADDAVTLAKIAAGTDGELITWDASGNPATVAVGTATHVLTSNGAGAAPTFQSVMADKATTAEIRNGTADVPIDPAGVESAAEFVTLTESGGNVALDWSSGINFNLTLTGDWTLSNPTNEEPGTWRSIKVTQGSTGAHVLSFGTDYQFPGGGSLASGASGAPVITTAIGAIDTLFLWNIDGTTTYVYTSQDFG